MNYLNEEIQEAATILSRAEVFRTSTRNTFFKRAKQENEKYNNRKFYNTVYHLVMETIRRKNKLDAFLDLIFGDKIQSFNLFQIALLRIVVYIRKEQKYYTKKRPSLNHLLTTAKRILAEKMDEIALFALLEGLRQIDVIEEHELLDSRSELEQVSLRYFHPEWLIEMLYEWLGHEDTIRLLETNNKKQPMWIRIVDYSREFNNADKIIEGLAGDDVTAIADQDFEDVLLITQAKRPVVLTSLFKTNRIVIQNKASSAVGHILEPFPNSTVIDLAAAPGMKSLHIWEKMERSGNLILLDVSEKRAKTLSKRAKKYTPNSYCLPYVMQADSYIPPLRSEIADRVLVDAPCSSSGIIGMYPDHKWRSESLAKELAVVQLNLLESALILLKKGGIGVYSVCSINPKEGEFVIGEMLQRNDNVELLDPGFGNSVYKAKIQGVELCRRVFPHIDGIDGFFYCKFRKKL
ncbi:MAG: RsmB/NOP family class I SAM-dependent RNA methyltransferase [Candidatus Hodarchaeota archaeon]